MSPYGLFVRLQRKVTRYSNKKMACKSLLGYDKNSSLAESSNFPWWFLLPPKSLSGGAI